MSAEYRPELMRRFLHWLEGERWCANCQNWAPAGHESDHPPLPEGERQPRRRYSDSEHGAGRRSSRDRR